MRGLQIVLLLCALLTAIGWGLSYVLWAHVGVPLGSDNGYLSLHQVRGHVQLNLFTHYPRERPIGIGFDSLARLDALGMGSVLQPSMFEFNRMDITRPGVPTATPGTWRMAGYTAGVPHLLIIAVFLAFSVAVSSGKPNVVKNGRAPGE